MELNDDDRSYLTKIYRHGMNHLIDDTIPNKLICIHSIHWVLERLLRIVTKDYKGLDYKDGFDKIFKKFANRDSVSLSPRLKKSIEKFNEIRNGMEHRNIPPDFEILKEILIDVRDFIKWLFKTIFKTTEFDFDKVPVVEEREIYKRFHDWIEKKILERKDKELEDSYDNIFICVIPATVSEDLISFSADSINDMVHNNRGNGVTISGGNPNHHPEIEKYYRSIRPIKRGQTYSVHDFLRIHNKNWDEEMILNKSGIVYIRLNYGSTLSEDGRSGKKIIFNPNPLFIREGKTRVSYSDGNSIYKPPFEYFCHGLVEDVLKVALFPFHPDCKKNLIKNPTKYFSAEFVFPNMIFNGDRRYLWKNPLERFGELNRKYLGSSRDLSKRLSFSYDEIEEKIIKLKEYVYSYFKNEADTGFC